MSNALETLIQITFPNATFSFDLGTPAEITVSYETEVENRYMMKRFIINGTEMVSEPFILAVTEHEVQTPQVWHEFVTNITPVYLKLPLPLKLRPEPESSPATPIRRVDGSSLIDSDMGCWIGIERRRGAKRDSQR